MATSKARLKIETHPQRATIDEKILSGDSYQAISAWCKESLNFDVSHMTIKRYADSTGLSNKRSNGIVQGMSAEEIDDYEAGENADMGISIPVFETEKELKEYARKMLIETYINQLALVKHKQTAYMQGRGRYPQNEITGLKTLLSCMGALSDDKDSVLDDSGA
jgi:hypothetical protein